MKAILMSIKPKWVEKIASGEKTVEVRKSVPKCGTPFKVYMYMTKEKNKVGRFDKNYVARMNAAKRLVGGLGKVVGEFVCDKIDHYKPFYRYNFNEIGLPSSSEQTYFFFEDDLKKNCLTFSEFKQYGHGAPLFGLHISDLKIYDTPKALSEFRKPCDGECFTCKYYKEDTLRLITLCFKPFITRPPQSWCYVEEV